LQKNHHPRGGVGKVTIIQTLLIVRYSLVVKILEKSPIIEREFKSGRHTLVVIDQGFELNQ
jgi:hypothetical protein